MEVCPLCSVSVNVERDAAGKPVKYTPVDTDLLAMRDGFVIPFHCKVCMSIKFPLQAVRDIVFLYPTPRPDKVGSIFLPDDEYSGVGNSREAFRPPIAVVLSAGVYRYRFHVNIKGQRVGARPRKMYTGYDIEVGSTVYYNKRVPWRLQVLGTDEKMHEVIYCGKEDITGEYVDGEQPAQ